MRALNGGYRAVVINGRSPRELLEDIPPYVTGDAGYLSGILFAFFISKARPGHPAPCFLAPLLRVGRRNVERARRSVSTRRQRGDVTYLVDSISKIRTCLIASMYFHSLIQSAHSLRIITRDSYTGIAGNHLIPNSALFARLRIPPLCVMLSRG